MNQKNPERVCRWWIFNNSKSGVESIWRSDWWTFVSVVVRSIPSSERDVMWMKESSPAGSGTSVINLVKIRRIKRGSFQKKTEQSWFYILIMIKKNCSFFNLPVTSRTLGSNKSRMRTRFKRQSSFSLYPSSLLRQPAFEWNTEMVGVFCCYASTRVFFIYFRISFLFLFSSGASLWTDLFLLHHGSLLTITIKERHVVLFVHL